MKVTNKTINICIPIHDDDYIRNFIFKNINYRRKVWNDFVEESKKYKGDNCMYRGFKPLKFKTEYFQKEKVNDIYDEYCVGISEQVSKEMNSALTRIRNENFSNKKKLWKFQFHSFDKYYGSFKVHNKSEDQLRNGNVSSRLHIINNTTMQFRIRGKNKYRSNPNAEYINIHLKEPLFKYRGIGNYYPDFVREYKVKGEYPVECWFNELDIKETCFIHKLGKFYIQLSINVTYKINKDDIKSRQKKAGIDTGIHNPAMLYNGESFKRIVMPEKIVRKIHYLERRARRLQHIKDRKYAINKERVKRGELESKYSNNYWKVRRKFRKVWNKIVNIRRYWIYTTTKSIATSYRKICVDRFKQPDNQNIKPNKLKHSYNFNNRFHCMYTFNEILKHMCEKYGCEYIDSPPNTTKLCSFCGTEYEYDTDDLRSREFDCHNKDCIAKGIFIDRDKNAAKNCYMYI